MDTFDVRLFTISAVVFSALSALLIIIINIINEEKKHRLLDIILIYYFCSHIFTETGFLLYFYAPTLFITLNWLFMLSLVSVPILFYRFIFSITKTSSTEKFSKYHYIAPVVISLFMLLLSIITPYKEQLLTVTGDGNYRGNSIMFYLFSNKLYFRFIFNVLYVFLSFSRLPQYHNYIIDYSANETKSSLQWVYILLFFMVGLMFIPFYGLFTSRSGLASSFVVYLQVAIMIFQYSFLTFHVIKGHYVLQEPRNYNELSTPTTIITHDVDLDVNNKVQLKKNILNKKIFDNYMKKHKPYLESNLKITDLSERIGVNRTYISSFINKEYGKNFSGFINQLRYQEYQQLRKNKTYDNFSNAELAQKVGFGSYRSYVRFETQQKEE